MKSKYLYFGVGGVLVVLVIIFLLMDDSSVKKENADAQLPPGHPPLSEMQQSEGDMKNGRTPVDLNSPSKTNVRQDFVHMVEKLREKVNKNPNDTSGVLELAHLLSDSHQFKEAAVLFERFLKTNKKNTTVMLDLSVCYFNLGQMEDAATITSTILKLEPSNSIALYNLGAIHATKGDKPKAKEVWENLIKKFPGSDDATRAKESIGKL